MYHMKKATFDGKYISVKFKGHDFSKTKEIIKALPLNQRFYRSEDKTWKVHNTIDNIKYLRKNNFDLSKELFEQIVPPLTKPWTNIKIPEEFSFLRFYQKECLQFLEYHNGRGLLALSPGLGKTVVSLAYFHWKNLFPVLIICPSITKRQWEREQLKWFNSNKKIKILNGLESIQELNEKYDIIVCNYEILSRHVEKVTIEKQTELKIDSYLLSFKRNKIKSMVIDECHRIKSDDAKITHAINFLSKGVPYFLALSGTPMISRPAELYNVLEIIKPNLFNNKYSYFHRFCDPQLVKTKDRTIFTFKGSTNAPELSYILKKEVMIRYKKEDIKNLPEKLSIIVPLELDNYGEYRKLSDEINKEIREGNEAAALTRFEKLKQKTFELKLNQIIEWIDEEILKTSKLLVFGWHREFLDILYKHYKSKSVKIVGGLSETKKYENVDRFIEEPKIQILFGNIGACGEGLDLLQTVCSTVAYVELGWGIKEISQGSGRIWREGQKNFVLEYFLIGEKTVEQEIMEIIDEKQKRSSSVLDGEDIGNDNLLGELYKRYKKGVK